MSKFEEELQQAIREPTLAKALTHICVWEMRNVVERSKDNSEWESCFEYSINRTVDAYVKEHGAGSVVN